ncbi:MAG: preprotein translocase subunit SecE [Deltaproteobacteria bacterium]|nr:preprotein translocase subunit SecE [Deltaproteobacteria bacterium]
MEQASIITRGKEFFSEARAELKKVTWPSKDQTLKATWVVLIGVIILAVILGLLDLGFSSLVKLFIK